MTYDDFAIRMTDLKTKVSNILNRPDSSYNVVTKELEILYAQIADLLLIYGNRNHAATYFKQK